MTITANLCDNAGFFGDDRPLGSAAIVSYSPFVQACKAFPEARSMCHLCLFEAKRPIFLAKRPTLLAKHTCLPGAASSRRPRSSCHYRGACGRSRFGGDDWPVGVARLRHEPTDGVVVTCASGAGLSQCISGGAQLRAAQRTPAVAHAHVWTAR